MKVVEFVEINKNLLKLLRKIGFSLDYVDYTGMFYDYKEMRANPKNTFRGSTDDVGKKYGMGHTKAWEIKGTEDLKPYIPKKTLFKKWFGTFVAFPLYAAFVAWIMTFIVK